MNTHETWMYTHEGREVVLVSARYGSRSYTFSAVVRRTPTQIVTEHFRYHVKSGQMVGGDARSPYLLVASEDNARRVTGSMAIEKLESYANQLRRAASAMTLDDAEALYEYLKNAPVELKP